MMLEGLGEFKNSITSLEIEPAAFKLMAQCLNHLLYLVHLPILDTGHAFW
jgi:hypothetical protein